jgi:PQQ-like domain
VGEGFTASEGRSADQDPDAPWRPGFDGWTGEDRTVEDRTGGEPTGDGQKRPTSSIGLGPAVDVDDTAGADPEYWSRARDQADPEPWVPQRRPPKPTWRPAAPAGPPVATVDGQPAQAATGQLVLIGLIIGAMLLAVGFVAVTIRPPSSTTITDDAVAAPIIPDRVDERWTLDFDELIGEVAFGGGLALVFLPSAGSVVAFDMGTGAERWRHAIGADKSGVSRIAVSGDRVLVQPNGPSGDGGIVALDRISGDEIWAADAGAGYRLVGPDTAARVVRAFGGGAADRTQRLEPIDAADGTVAGKPILVAEVAVPGTDDMARRVSDRRATIWSWDEMADIAGPIDTFNLAAIAAVDDAVVALDFDGRIVAFDQNGDRTDERPFESDAFGEFTGRATLAGVVPDRNLGIIASGSSLGFRIADGQIDTAWKREGRALQPVPTEIGPISVLIGPEPGSGEINDSLIDAVSGETIRVTDAGETREREPILGHNAYVLAPEIGAGERELTALRYDGTELWTMPIPRSARYSFVDGTVVLIERASTGSAVTVAH